MDFRSNGGTHVALLCVFLKYLHPLTEKVADGYHIRISKEPFSAVNPKHHTVKWPSNVSVFILGKLCNLLSQQIFDVCAAFPHPPSLQKSSSFTFATRLSQNIHSHVTLMSHHIEPFSYSVFTEHRNRLMWQPSLTRYFFIWFIDLPISLLHGPRTYHFKQFWMPKMV